MITIDDLKIALAEDWNLRGIRTFESFARTKGQPDTK